MKMYRIGQFSKITRLTIKALRLYHEKGILSPSHIDEQSGYRYYDEKLLEKAYTISNLKALDFSLKEIIEIMRNFSEDADMVGFLQSKTNELESKIDHYGKIRDRLHLIIETHGRYNMKSISKDIETRHIPDTTVIGIRYKGKYSDIGQYFGRLFKLAGFKVAGKPGALYYDGEYKEDDADIEAFVPVKEGFSKNETKGKRMPGGKAHCLIHTGPYNTLHLSYKKMADYIAQNKLETDVPLREVYLKGPGMIFRGNPEKYITEIQFFEKGG